MATKEKGGAKGGKSAAPAAKGGKGAGAPGAKGGKSAGASKSSKGAENSRRNAEKAARGPHTGAALAPVEPRLKRYYATTVREKLAKQFSLANVHEIPTLEKIVLNCGVGEAIKTPKVLDSVCEELELITGQRPIRRKAKKSIANYGLREGQEIGAQVTLRGARMWEFLDRFVTISIPRIRDFRGLGTRAFDGRGNFSLGVKEQMIFPEINYDMVEQVHGMDITFVTSSTKDDQALALLRELGMPFKGESPNIPTLT
jgi:large subunit ribosomal protein L5